MISCGKKSRKKGVFKTCSRLSGSLCLKVLIFAREHRAPCRQQQQQQQQQQDDGWFSVS